MSMKKALNVIIAYAKMKIMNAISDIIEKILVSAQK